MLKGITCVTFDDGIKASQGLWLYNENVVVSDDSCKSDKCGFFNSSAQSKLELAYFSNSFDNFETFSVSFFFKRAAGTSGEQSLLDNSECSDDGSMFARSASGKVLGSATNMAGDSVDVDYVVSAPCLQEIKDIALVSMYLYIIISFCFCHYILCVQIVFISRTTRIKNYYSKEAINIYLFNCEFNMQQYTISLLLY